MSIPRNLAILSTENDAYSSTFIRSHLDLNADKIIFLYGGYTPTYLAGQKNCLENKIRSKWFSVQDRVTGKHEAALKLLGRHLKENQINAALIEYGPVGVRCMDLLEQLNIPFIVHFHGYDASRYEVVDRFKDGYRGLFKKAKSIVVVSEKMKEMLMEMGAPSEKLCLNHYGPNPIFLDVRPDYKSNNILHVGRFVDKKAPHVTIAAFKNLSETHPEARLKFVGDGPLLESSQELVNQLGLTDKIEFLGIKSPEEIASLMADSLMLVQHSVRAKDGDMEGTPNTILEASAAGLPVVSTMHAGIPDVILHNQTGLLGAENNQEVMAENMKAIFGNRSLAEKLGKAGKKRIKEHFTREKYLGKLQQLVDEMMTN